METKEVRGCNADIFYFSSGEVNTDGVIGVRGIPDAPKMAAIYCEGCFIDNVKPRGDEEAFLRKNCRLAISQQES